MDIGPSRGLNGLDSRQVRRIGRRHSPAPNAGQYMFHRCSAWPPARARRWRQALPSPAFAGDAPWHKSACQEQGSRNSVVLNLHLAWTIPAPYPAPSHPRHSRCSSASPHPWDPRRSDRPVWSLSRIEHASPFILNFVGPSRPLKNPLVQAQVGSQDVPARFAGLPDQHSFVPHAVVIVPVQDCRPVGSSTTPRPFHFYRTDMFGSRGGAQTSTSRGSRTQNEEEHG